MVWSVKSLSELTFWAMLTSFDELCILEDACFMLLLCMLELCELELFCMLEELCMLLCCFFIAEALTTWSLSPCMGAFLKPACWKGDAMLSMS